MERASVRHYDPTRLPVGDDPVVLDLARLATSDDAWDARWECVRCGVRHLAAESWIAEVADAPGAPAHRDIVCQRCADELRELIDA